MSGRPAAAAARARAPEIPAARVVLSAVQPLSQAALQHALPYFREAETAAMAAQAQQVARALRVLSPMPLPAAQKEVISSFISALTAATAATALAAMAARAATPRRT